MFCSKKLQSLQVPPVIGTIFVNVVIHCYRCYCCFITVIIITMIVRDARSEAFYIHVTLLQRPCLLSACSLNLRFNTIASVGNSAALV